MGIIDKLKGVSQKTTAAIHNFEEHRLKGIERRAALAEREAIASEKFARLERAKTAISKARRERDKHRWGGYGFAAEPRRAPPKKGKNNDFMSGFGL